MRGNGGRQGTGDNPLRSRILIAAPKLMLRRMHLHVRVRALIELKNCQKEGSKTRQGRRERQRERGQRDRQREPSRVEPRPTLIIQYAWQRQQQFACLPTDISHPGWAVIILNQPERETGGNKAGRRVNSAFKQRHSVESFLRQFMTCFPLLAFSSGPAAKSTASCFDLSSAQFSSAQFRSPGLGLRSVPTSSFRDSVPNQSQTKASSGTKRSPKMF